MSTLSLAALAVAQGELARGVRGGVAPYARFRSADIDAYMALVGLPPPADPSVPWHPWCAAFVHAMFVRAVRDGIEVMDGDDTPPTVPPVPCPRTASALHLWELAPIAARSQLPAPGDIFIVDHGKGRGHCGIIQTASPDGQTISSIEGDTSADGSRTGDAVGEHLWKPSEGARGKLVGYLNFG